MNPSPTNDFRQLRPFGDHVMRDAIPVGMRSVTKHPRQNDHGSRCRFTSVVASLRLVPRVLRAVRSLVASVALLPFTAMAEPEISIEQQAGMPLVTGNVSAWGLNGNGQTTVPAGLTGVQAIAAGTYHTVTLKSNGTIAAWGNNNNGQLDVPGGLSGVKAIAAGDRHTVAVKSDGTVVAWGSNNGGQLDVPGGLSGVVAVAAGERHTVALKDDGTVVAWGQYSFGVPDGLTGVQTIVAGGQHTVALKNDGTLVAWGDDTFGQTNIPFDMAGVTAIAAGGGHTVALKNDGTVIAWGWNLHGQTTVPFGLTDVVAIAAGDHHTVALKGDGTVVVWGGNDEGQAVVPVGLSGVKAISAGYGHTVALADSIVAFGNQVRGTNSAAKSFTIRNTGITALGITSVTVTGGDASDFSVNTAGMLNSLPANTGQTTFTVTFNPGALGARTSKLRVVNTDSDETPFAITLTGTGVVIPEISIDQPDGNSLVTDNLTGWGWNLYGQSTVPGGLTGVTAIAAGGEHTAVLKYDGTIVAWGSNGSGQATVPAAAQSGVASIAAGGHHTVALKTDGSVIAWGDNYSGQTTVPTAAQANVTAIAAGWTHTVALKTDGTVVAWGWNLYGQTTVPAGLGVAAIAAGERHTVALKYNGTVVEWGGISGGGYIDMPSGLSGVTAISAGNGHTVALKNDGTVVTWGHNNYGQINMPAGLTGVTAIAAGAYFTLALKNDGTVVAWGDNPFGQTNVPSGLSGVTLIAAGGMHSMVRSGSTVAFGNQTLFLPSIAKTFTIRNQGTAPLTISNISTVGGNDFDFSVSTAGMLTTIPELTGQTTFTVTFTPRALGIRGTKLRVVNNDGDESVFDIVLTGTGLNTLAAWRQQYFGTTSNSGDAANIFDYDKDGLVNLIEYAFGQIPTQAGSAQLPQLQLGGGNLFYGFTQPPVGGITYGAEWSTTLQGGSWTPILNTATPPQHLYSVPAAGPQKFLRFRISNP